MSISNHPVEQEELMAYLDGEISPERAGETASHLEHCRECQQLAADFREVSQMLLTWRVEESDPALAKDLDCALKNHGSDKAVPHRQLGWSILSPRYWPKPVWGLAGAGLVVTFFVIFALSTARMRMVGMKDEPRFTPQTRTEMPTDGSGNGRVDSSPNIGGFLFLKNGPLQPSPSATPRPGYDGLGRIRTADQEVDGQNESDNSATSVVNGPMIVRTAELEVTTKDFDKARPGVEEILKRRHGYVGELNVNTPTGSARSLTGTLRVPSNQLEATLADLKGLGRTDKESQGGEEVTQQYVDLQARLANAKHTEQRLTDILRERTGKLSDVLAVEMQISRVRGEIEQMEAQRKTMKNQVDFATLSVTVTEEYKEQLKAVPPSTGTQFRNAAVEGYRSLVDGIISVLLWLLSAGPTLLVWAAILFFPARMVWRKVRDRRNRA
jgi:hypothetical protein